MITKIFHNANIITLDKNNSIHSAMYIEDGIIKFIGNDKDTLKYKKEKTEIIDLKNQTIIPGFIDTNSNIVAHAQTLLVCDLFGSKNINDLISKIKKYIEKLNYKKNKLIISFGCDDDIYNQLKIDNDIFLNSFDNPVLIIGNSQKDAILNQKALDKFEINNSVKNKSYIYGEEFNKIAQKVEPKTLEDLIQAIKISENEYIQFGITTALEVESNPKDLNILFAAAKQGLLEIDHACYLDLQDSKDIIKQFKGILKGYSNNLRLAGAKLNIDGTPINTSAFLSKPYYSNKKYNKAHDYKGICNYTIEQSKSNIQWCIDNDIQLITLANGDGAIDLFLDSIIKLDVEDRRKFSENRPIIAQAQLIRDDQLDLLKKYNILSTYLINDIWNFSHIYQENLGDEIINLMCPLNNLISKNLIFSIHQYSPLYESNLFQSIWCATNRKIRATMETLNKEQIISTTDAIKATTINAAYLCFEETKKGSLEVNKFADFIIVSENPFDDKFINLSTIKVMSTYKSGKLLFNRLSKIN